MQIASKPPDLATLAGKSIIPKPAEARAVRFDWLQVQVDFDRFDQTRSCAILFLLFKRRNTSLLIMPFIEGVSMGSEIDIRHSPVLTNNIRFS